MSTSRTRQELLVDIAVHFVKANGRTASKMFKMKRVALEPGARVGFETNLSFAR